MRTEAVSFSNAAGHVLAGRLDLPLIAPNGFAIFAHCFTCGKNLKSARDIAHALNAAGFAVLRFDFTGLGESEGEFGAAGFAANVEDLIAAASFLARDYQAPSLLVGHSLGGAAVLHAAARIESVKAVATIGAPFDPAHVARLLGEAAEVATRDGSAEVKLASGTFRITRQFIDELRVDDPAHVIHDLRKPILVLHSPIDETVGVDNAGSIFQAALHPKSFISLDRADHLLSNTDDARYAGEVIAAWATRYAGVRAPPRALPDLHEAQVVTRTADDEGFLTDINAAGHALLADEPVAVGGTDRGPSPYDLLVAALGACTTMTLQLFARRKGWPLEAATVRLTHRKIHASDCENCETADGHVDVIERVIELAGSLSDEQRQKLLEIADKCPVHRTIHGEIKVNTRLAL
ncbi:MAG: bifunctional alpha/beta hydrolase/OsmC family protein [Betaproteobacteria bacterium]